jgi:hypothetical protein
MASPLANLFSSIDSAKRKAADAFSNPLDYLSTVAGQTQENLNQTLELQNKAFGDPTNPTKITDQVAFNDLSEQITGQITNFAPAGIIKFTNVKAPNIAELPFFRAGPASIKPSPIAPSKPLYRETSPSGVFNLLQYDTAFDTPRLFVTDNIDLAIGQGSNKGVLVTFRPNSLSGSVNKKPGTSELSGFEYVTDIVAPRAVESVVFKDPKMLKQINSKAARVLKTEFSKIENKDKSISFVRKPEFLNNQIKEEVVDVFSDPFKSSID